VRKHYFALVLFVAHPALAQISSGTIIVVDFAEDQLVIAADSRSTLNENAGSPNDTECKTTAFGNQLIFATTGSNRYTRNDPTDWISPWDNVDEARIAYDSTVTTPPEKRLGVVLEKWALAVCVKG